MRKVITIILKLILWSKESGTLWISENYEHLESEIDCLAILIYSTVLSPTERACYMFLAFLCMVYWVHPFGKIVKISVILIGLRMVWKCIQIKIAHVHYMFLLESRQRSILIRFSPSEEQAGINRDKAAVDACTNRINSLLLKVKPQLY